MSFIFHSKLVISIMFYNKEDAATEVSSFLEVRGDQAEALPEVQTEQTLMRPSRPSSL